MLGTPTGRHGLQQEKPGLLENRAVEIGAGFECARSQRLHRPRVDEPAPRWPVKLWTMVVADKRDGFIS
jgi:hypothetical protein